MVGDKSVKTSLVTNNFREVEQAHYHQVTKRRLNALQLQHANEYRLILSVDSLANAVIVCVEGEDGKKVLEADDIRES